MFVPSGPERIVLLLQQAAAAGGSFVERSKAHEADQIQLHAKWGEEPPLPVGRLADPGVRIGPARVDYGRASPGAYVNGSAVGGEVTLLFDSPPSAWLYVIVHGAAVSDAAVEYDVRVAVRSSSEVPWTVGYEAGWRYASRLRFTYDLGEFYL